MTLHTHTQTPRPRVTPPGPHTLSIEIGSRGLEALVLGPDGTALTERVRIDTPQPATPTAVLEGIRNLIDQLAHFDRVSVGFPGVVEHGVIRSAPNLHDDWEGFELARRASEALRRPVRVINDAGMRGYAVIEGKGLEVVLTLGTGFASAVFSDGHLVENLELAHRPFRNGKTFAHFVGKKALKKVGKKKWNKRVAEVIEQTLTWNPRKIYIGGGNAKHLRIELPSDVEIAPNRAGLLGGVALWRDAGPYRLS